MSSNSEETSMLRSWLTLAMVGVGLGGSSAVVFSLVTETASSAPDFTPCEQRVFSATSEQLNQSSSSVVVGWGQHVQQHAIRLHMAKPMLFEEEPSQIDVEHDSLAFFLSVLPNGVFPDEPFRSSQVDPSLNMIWLIETDVTPMVRAVMLIEDLSYLLAIQHGAWKVSSDSLTHFLYKHQTMLATFRVLNDMTNCEWEAAVQASVAEQRQVMTEEALPPEVVFDFGVPGDGWRIQALFGDLPDRDRSYLLWLMMAHANLARVANLESSTSFAHLRIPALTWDS